jgi:hypothetical protein
MRMSADHTPSRGQSSLEYLLVLAVVAVVVIASFGPGSLVSQVQNSAATYYNTVTTAITGKGNPVPINGGWCPVTCPPAGSSGANVLYGACECPAPAFGGAFCPGGSVGCGAGQTCSGQVVDCSGTTSCACPTGEQCNAQGQCVCANGLNCSSIPNSSPDPTCTKCLCWNGTFWDPTTKSCDFCTVQGGQCTTSLDGQSCTVVTCPVNEYCNTSVNACQCIAGTVWNGTSCVFLPCWPNPPCPPLNGCGADNCGNVCGLNGGVCLVGLCSSGGGGPGTCNCTPNPPCPVTNGCGIDNCGNACGTCPNGETCNNPNGGVGTCSCTGSSCTCVPTVCTVSSQCGSPLGINNCNAVCQGQQNICPVANPPLVCDLNSLTCVCGGCYPIYQCNSTAGFDNCGQSCTATPGTCPPGTNCNTTTNTCTCIPSGICAPLYQCCPSPPDSTCTQGVDTACSTPCTVTPPPCPTGDFCNSFDQCRCVSDCGTADCGFDQCGQPCGPLGGNCPSGQTCSNTGTPGVCTACTLQPSCTGFNCGFDACGDLCGTCPTGQVCNNSNFMPGNCINTCQPNCTGAACGASDGCSGLCNGTCPPGFACNDQFVCACVPQCTGAVCGASDGCGGQCGAGSCPPGQSCVNNACCTTGSGCGSNVCGPDACGNPNGCGACPGNLSCVSGSCACTPGTGCNGNICGPDQCSPPNPNGCGICPGGETCNASGQCVANFVLQIVEFANCATCAPICSILDLGGNCGAMGDCGGQPGCPVNYSGCVQNPTDEAWSCGSCFQETLVSGTGCANGIASVLSDSVSGQTPGGCGSNPTPGTAQETYSVVCNP